MSRPLLFVLAAALLWGTGGLFIKWVSLSGLELSCWRSFFAIFTVAFFTRHEGFGLNRLTAVASVLYAALLLLLVVGRRHTPAEKASSLQYTESLYVTTRDRSMYKKKV